MGETGRKKKGKRERERGKKKKKNNLEKIKKMLMFYEAIS